jgi:molybdenum cofactor cytidylyltransferase
MVCDQPFVTPSVIEHLIRRHEESSKNIVASAYANTLGIPVLFNKEVFADLMKLQGAEGAKRIITHHPEKVDSVVFPLGSVDIDTKDDYRSLLA